VYRSVAAAASGERGIGRIAQPLAVRPELEVGRFVLGTVQWLPLHREANLRRTPDSSERLEGGNTAGPSTGHRASRRNYAAARRRYAAASAIALSKCAAVAGVAVVRSGPRRRSSEYAAAVRLVKRRSPAWAGTGAVYAPATERSCDCPGSGVCRCDREIATATGDSEPRNGGRMSPRGLEKPGAAVVYFRCLSFLTASVSSPHAGVAQYQIALRANRSTSSAPRMSLLSGRTLVGGAGRDGRGDRCKN
jgi:hypothetical protein